MKKNEVCIISTVHPPFDTRIFQKQAKTLVEAGYNVTLIVQHERSAVVEGVKIIPLPEPGDRFSRIFGSTIRAFSLALKQDADFYHFHDPELLLVGFLLKLFTSSSVIYDVHENYSEKIKLKDWIPCSNVSAELFHQIESFVSNKLSAVITVTEEISKDFSNSKVEVIHNYPRLNEVNVSDVSRKVRESFDPKKFHVIYTGGFTRNRGIKQTIQAMGYLSKDEYDLIVLGKAPDEDFLAELRNLEGFSRVKYHGVVDFEAVFSYMKLSDAGVVLNQPVGSYDKALPNKMFEYMSVGLPVIASDFPRWRKIISENNCGINLDSTKPRKIAEAIEYLSNNPGEKKEMAEKGPGVARKKFNWENEAKKLLVLYEGLGGSV